MNFIFTADLSMSLALQAINRFELVLLAKSNLVLDRFYALIENFKRGFNLCLSRLQARIDHTAEVPPDKHIAML